MTVSATGNDSPTVSPIPGISATPTFGQSVSSKTYPSSFNSLVLVEINSNLEAEDFYVEVPSLDRVSSRQRALICRHCDV
jgi:hypothetical protein